jgi:hypothetical protein
MSLPAAGADDTQPSRFSAASLASVSALRCSLLRAGSAPSAGLLGGAHQHLVDGHVPGPVTM